MAPSSSNVSETIKGQKKQDTKAKQVRQESVSNRKQGRKKFKEDANQSNIKRQLKIQKALFEIADAASSVKSLDAFYKKLHRAVGKLMYAKSFYVILYDSDRDIIGGEKDIL